MTNHNGNNNQLKYFESWLDNNEDNFIYKPILLTKTDDYLYLRYQNIINNIVVSVSVYGTIDIRLENMLGLGCVDLLADFLIVLRINDDSKYYNESLLESYRIYYDRPEDVYNDEFKYFLDWSNRMISPDKYIYTYNCYGRHSFTKIIKPDELHLYKEVDSEEESSKIIQMKMIPSRP